MGTAQGHPSHLQRDPRADPSVLPAEAAGVAPAGTRPAASEGPERRQRLERGRAGPYRETPGAPERPGTPRARSGRAEPAPGFPSRRVWR